MLFELSDVFDAHGVCAAAAHTIAVYADTPTVVSIANAGQPFYDVWISDNEGRVQQARWQREHDSFIRIIQSGQADLWRPAQLSNEERREADLWRLMRQTVLAVPLPFPGRRHVAGAQGAICLLDPPHNCRISAEVLEALAVQITSYLDRAHLRQRSDQQHIEFSIISDISYSLTATLDLDSIFAQVADAVRRALGAEAISIGLTDEVRNELVFVDTMMGPSFAGFAPIRLKMGRGIAGWVAKHGETAIVHDAYSDPRFYAKYDQLTGFRTNSLLCVPLIIEGRVIGVLEVLNKQHSRFDENDARLVQAISGPLAVAIENAKLHANLLSDKRRVDTLISSLSEGLMTTDLEGRITDINDALTSLLRVEKRHQKGTYFADLIETRSEDFRKFWQTVYDSSEPFPQIQCDLHRADGKYVPVLVSGTAITGDGDKVSELVFVFSDLRHVRELERMRDDFFHNIVHELRTPLNTILIYIRLLKDGKAAADSAKASRFMEAIEHQSDQLQKMVRQMLHLAKLEDSELHSPLEAVSLNNVFEQILPALSVRAADKGLTFIVEVPAGLPLVMGSAEMLSVVIKNLVNNSLQYTDKGQVILRACVDGGFVRVEVADEGIGIPAEAIPNLFQRFYRAQPAVERGIAGFGLGLAMVKEALQRYGGSIEVVSQEGQGTTFTAKLPLARELNEVDLS
ncbi:MAG: ATP-binding protein [Candidatus Promineifilaceae bacterium]